MQVKYTFIGLEGFVRDMEDIMMEFDSWLRNMTHLATGFSADDICTI